MITTVKTLVNKILHKQPNNDIHTMFEWEQLQQQKGEDNDRQRIQDSHKIATES